MGEVVEDRDPNSDLYLAVFGFRVDEVVRGLARRQSVIEIAYVRSGLPLRVCSDSMVRVQLGEIVAFAFNAVAPDGSTRINTLAYVRGAPDSILVGIERITLGELRHLAQASAPHDNENPASPLNPFALAAVAGGFGGLILLLWVRPRLARRRT